MWAVRVRAETPATPPSADSRPRGRVCFLVTREKTTAKKNETALAGSRSIHPHPRHPSDNSRRSGTAQQVKRKRQGARVETDSNRQYCESCKIYSKHQPDGHLQ